MQKKIYACVQRIMYTYCINTYIWITDSLNHLILSELHITGQHAEILRMVSNETHYIAYLAFELLLKYQDKETREWTYMLPALQAGLKAHNPEVREVIVERISRCLRAQSSLVKDQSEAIKEEVEQPFWNLFHQALSHGLESIQDDAAQCLRIQQRMEVMPYVYRKYLQSKSQWDQERACDIICQLKPQGATAKLLERILHDPLESANISSIKSAIAKLNDYSQQIEDQLFALFTENTSSNKVAKMSYKLLLHFSGFALSPSKKMPSHLYRLAILCKMMTHLLQNSMYTELQECLSLLSKHLLLRDVGVGLATEPVRHGGRDAALQEARHVRVA